MRHFYYIDSDDVETQLGQTSETRVASYSGLGYAPLEHFLQGVPSQHRQLHRGLKFRPRVIQFGMWDFRTSTPLQDTRHTTLLAALTADKGEGTLKIILDDGTDRRIKCYVFQGPDFDSEGRRDWFQSYILRFLCRDPFFFDPTQNSEPKSFTGAVAADIAIENTGHIGAWPYITLNGPLTDPKVQLVTTNEHVELDYAIGGGDHVDIDCEAGTVLENDTTDLIALGKLTKTSVLFDLPRGSHTIRLTCASGTTAMTFKWSSRFLGI